MTSTTLPTLDLFGADTDASTPDASPLRAAVDRVTERGTFFSFANTGKLRG